MSSASLVKAAAAVLLLLLSVLSATAPPAAATVYKVGGNIGWTTLGSPNYTAWAVDKTFHVGDTLLFEYNKNYHNVEQVSKADYDSCSAASPKATYTSGNDSIPIKSAGHLYFLCGVPTHCQLGQKVDILVSSAAPSPSAPGPSSVPPSAPKAASLGSSTREGAGLAVAAAAGVATFYSLIMAL